MSSDNASIVDAYSRMQKRIYEESQAAKTPQEEQDSGTLNEDITEEKGYPFELKKGAFHKWLGKDESEKLTPADIDKGLASKDEHVRKMAQFAKNAKKFHHAEAIEEGKDGKEKDVALAKTEIEKAVKELEEGTDRSEVGANRKMSGEEKPGFYIKKGDKRVSDRHVSMDHAMKTYKELSDLERKGCKIVNESMEEMILDEAIMNPGHDEADQVILKKLHKVMPELGLKKAVHSQSFKSKNGMTHNIYHADQPVPEHMKHMLKDVKVVLSVNHDGNGNHSASLAHHYSHPNGSNNGDHGYTPIGEVHFDKESKKHVFHPSASGAEKTTM